MKRHWNENVQNLLSANPKVILFSFVASRKEPICWFLLASPNSQPLTDMNKRDCLKLIFQIIRSNYSLKLDKIELFFNILKKLYAFKK